MLLTVGISRAALADAPIGATLLTGCASPALSRSRGVVHDGQRGRRDGDRRQSPDPLRLPVRMRAPRADVLGGLECWRATPFDARRFDKVLVSRIQISLAPKPGEASAVDPADLKTLTDCFHDALVKALELET